MDNLKKQKGFTVVELLIVALMISVLLALAIPIVIKARIAANEVNARKAMQVLRDAEVEYFEQDMDNDGSRDFTAQIGDSSTEQTLRCPADPGGGCTPFDALIDDSFEGAVADGSGAVCFDSKAGYCFRFAGDVDGENQGVLSGSFGWQASMTSVRKNGRRDFAVYEDGVIRCEASQETRGNAGTFQAKRISQACDS